jgi:hypothetical protein
VIVDVAGGSAAFDQMAPQRGQPDAGVVAFANYFER